MYAGPVSLEGRCAAQYKAADVVLLTPAEAQAAPQTASGCSWIRTITVVLLCLGFSAYIVVGVIQGGSCFTHWSWMAWRILVPVQGRGRGRGFKRLPAARSGNLMRGRQRVVTLKWC